MLRKDKFLFILALILTIVQVASSLFIPIVVGKAIDYMPGASLVNFSKILNYVFLLVILIATMAISGFFMQYFMNKITNKLLKRLRDDLFIKIDSLPIEFVDRHSEGDILMRIVGDIDEVGNGLLQTLTQATSGVITIIMTLVFMLAVAYQVALIVIVLTPLSLLSAYLISKYSFLTFKKQANIKGELSSHTNEMFNLEKEVKTYNYENKAYEKFASINIELEKVGVKAQFLSSLVNPVTRFVNALVYASVGVYGALRASLALISVGDLTVFLNYASSYTKPFNDISSVVAEMQNSLASLKRIFEVLDTNYEQKSVEYELEKISGEVEFKNVFFSYNKDKELIKNFNLKVQPGQKIAIVGPTGSGKTTIINLLMRFYELDQGQILVDGKDISLASKVSLRNNLGMVLQDTWLYKASVFDNICYGLKNVSLEDVKKAASLTHADTIIERLEKGYDTIIANDSGLSGGEKQLICITRLALRSPNILILDEATSNIDTRLEVLVQEAFLKLMKNKTTFVIAHRLQTITSADLILVMENGNVIEIGNHQELLAKDGFYKKLFMSQYSICEGNTK